MKTIYFAFKQPTMEANLTTFNKWNNLFYYFNLAKKKKALKASEEAFLATFSLDREGYKYRVEFGINQNNDFEIISQVEDKPAATTDYYASPMRFPAASFDLKKYIKENALGLSVLSENQKIEMFALMDMESFGEELSEEQQVKLAAYEGLRTLTAVENELLQSLQTKKELCQNWLLMPFPKEIWDSFPVELKTKMQRILGTIDEVIENFN